MLTGLFKLVCVYGGQTKRFDFSKNVYKYFSGGDLEFFLFFGSNLELLYFF